MGYMHDPICVSTWSINAKPSIAKQSNAKHSEEKQCNAMQCNAMQCNAMQCNAMQCNAMQCKAKQFKAKQCIAKPSKAFYYCSGRDLNWGGAGFMYIVSCRSLGAPFRIQCDGVHVGPNMCFDLEYKFVGGQVEWTEFFKWRDIAKPRPAGLLLSKSNIYIYTVK